MLRWRVMAGVKQNWRTSCILMFSTTYSLSLTPLSPSDLLCSSLKHPLHLHISIRVMVRLLCVIRVENNINNNNKNNSSLWSREERRRKVFDIYIKEIRWSRLCFHCVHAKVVSDPARVVLTLGASLMAQGELQDMFSRMGSQTLQPPKACHGLKLWPSIDIDFLSPSVCTCESACVCFSLGVEKCLGNKNVWHNNH